jgi:hypothetical protein
MCEQAKFSGEGRQGWEHNRTKGAPCGVAAERHGVLGCVGPAGCHRRICLGLFSLFLPERPVGRGLSTRVSSMEKIKVGALN